MKKNWTIPFLSIALILCLLSGPWAQAEPSAAKTPSKKKEAASERILRKEVVVPATLEQVWHCWTTEEGIADFFSPESKIELKPGGAYYIYMMKMPPGKTIKRGTEGCKLLSYIPQEMLAFEWNFPPAVPTLRDSGALTQVVLRFREVGDGKVKVEFAQLGWKKGEDWDKGYAYFDKAWSFVLGRLKEHLGKDQSGGKSSGEPVSEDKKRTWTDKHVKVTAIEGPEKRQDFEMEIPVPIERVWNILSSADGFKRLGGKDPRVELKPGGAYSFWPGAPNKVLAFVPREMLSTSGSAPPKFPNVRKGGTWSAYFFDRPDDSHTRLRLAVVGWRPGEKEWDDAYDYFLKNNPIFLNSVYDALVKEGDRESAGGMLRHEALIDAPVAEVWEAFTTKKGIESWMVAHGEFDLRVGGKMRTHYDTKGVIGDENTIENTILSYEPMRMLSIKATKCPANFPLKAAIDKMWTVVYFEPVGSDQTRVTCVGMGFDDDEESQKLREHFDGGNAYTLRKLQEKFAKPKDGSAGGLALDRTTPGSQKGPQGAKVRAD